MSGGTGPVAVIGVGVCTSLGLDAESSLAGVEAGLSRMVETEAFGAGDSAAVCAPLELLGLDTARGRRLHWLAGTAYVDLVRRFETWKRVDIPLLNENEAYYVEYRGDGRYEFKYFMTNPAGAWGPIFSVVWTLPIGSVGMMREEVLFARPDPGVTEQGALRMARAFVVPEDFGTPPGAITLRAAWSFRTPAGWDSVYTPVLNMVDRPIAPMLIVRVETDWYAHQTEFRYVLQPGEGLPGSHNLPIGQVHFVPREEVTLIECSDDEVEEVRRLREEFSKEKVEHRTTTRFGLEYSPHYSRESRARREDVQAPAQDGDEE